VGGTCSNFRGKRKYAHNSGLKTFVEEAIWKPCLRWEDYIKIHNTGYENVFGQEIPCFHVS
jgi:hypothetical protein